ncbi:MAG TPA: TolC family protein [Longimicrobium sp.]|nr:TolC family protein [Longimicrobium sp.]
MTPHLLALALAAAPTQQVDTLQLAALQEAAVRRDPRGEQFALQRQASALRLRSIDSELYPSLRSAAEVTRQSEKVTIPVQLPGGQSIPTPSRTRYRMTVDAEERFYDPGRALRRDVERARLAESEASVRAELFGLRDEVNGAFFAALLAQQRGREAALLESDLEARLAEMRARVRAGTALEGDAAAIEAQLLGARQEQGAALADRRAALAVLRDLTGADVGEGDVLAVPALAAEVERVRAAGAQGAAVRARPEYQRLGATRERLGREAAAAQSSLLPHASATGQLGWGRSVRAAFDDDPKIFGQLGVRVEWAPWDWGRTRRQQQEIALQQQVVTTQEADLTRRLQRQVEDDLQEIDRLSAALADDERVVALRETIEREARAQLREGVLGAADYADRRSDVTQARVRRAQHAVQLAQARARYLTTLGVPLPGGAASEFTITNGGGR